MPPSSSASRFVGGRLRAHQAEPAGVVGAHRSRRAAQEAGQRRAGGDRPAHPTAPCRAPTRPCAPRPVTPISAKRRSSLVAMANGATLSPRTSSAASSSTAAIDSRAAAPVAEHVGAAGDALFGQHLDQQQGRGAHGGGAGSEHVAQRHFDRRAADAAQAQTRRSGRRPQSWLPPSACSARMSAIARFSGVGTPLAWPSSTTPPASQRTSSRLPRCRS